MSCRLPFSNITMRFLDSLEHKYGKHIPENLTYYLLIGQIVSYLLVYTFPHYRMMFPLIGALVYAGEWWRLILFVFTPTSDSLIWVAFTWYMFYFFGTGLEQRWGSFRYLVYLAIAYLGLILCAVLFPEQTITGGSLFISVFLAFAFLYPDLKLMIFFILPIKVKWLGILGWIGICSTIFLGPVPIKVVTLVSVSNFLLFFRQELFGMVRAIQPQLKPLRNTLTVREEKGAKNVCAVCKKYEMDYLDMDFRYCTDCNPITCYCADHLENHRHKKIRMVH